MSSASTTLAGSTPHTRSVRASTAAGGGLRGGGARGGRRARARPRRLPATFAVPLAIRDWGGRAPDADAYFVRVLVSLSGYLLPMAVSQARFGP